MPKKILIVEDDPDHIEITRRILQKSGGSYQVDTAVNAGEGLEKLSRGLYDLILCDYRLPDGTALDILKGLKAGGNDIPLVAVTAMGNEKVAVDIMKEGAYDYIVKDSSYDEILDVVIKKSIDRHTTEKEKKRLERDIREAYEQLKATQDQLIQAEKLNAVGQLACGVAHEVRNPLGIILQGVNYLENRVSLSGEGIPETLKMLKENIKRADKIIDSLFDFSRASTIELREEEIAAILEEALVLLRARLKFDNIELVTEIDSGLPKVLADKNKLEQVFINLLLNSVQAMPKGGRVAIRAYRKKLSEPGAGIGRRGGDYFKAGESAVIVEIEDTGSGISEADMKRIFDPFFTTKGPREGAGLGLSVTRNILAMHKALIEVESQEGKGTRVTVTLKVKGEGNG